MASRSALVAALAALPVLAAGSLALAQTEPCLPGNPYYDDAPCVAVHHPARSHATVTVDISLDAARYLSGGTLDSGMQETLGDELSELRSWLGGRLPAIVDGHGTIHTPDVRVSMVVLPSGHVGRVRLLTHFRDALDRRIAEAITSSLTSIDPLPTDGSEMELVVSFHPTLDYVRSHCCDVDD